MIIFFIYFLNVLAHITWPSCFGPMIAWYIIVGRGFVVKEVYSSPGRQEEKREMMGPGLQYLLQGHFFL